MYDFGIEEKEFQLMLDVANEKLELNENRFRIISNTMHRIRDSGKLSEYDKTQVGLLCNKFSIAVENLNGKTEYEVAMEEMSGGMMALVAAGVLLVSTIIAKILGFFTGNSSSSSSGGSSEDNTTRYSSYVSRKLNESTKRFNNEMDFISQNLKKALGEDTVKMSSYLAELELKEEYEKKLINTAAECTNYVFDFTVMPETLSADEIEKLIEAFDPNNIKKKILEENKEWFSSHIDMVNNFLWKKEENLHTRDLVDRLISNLSDNYSGKDVLSEIKNKIKIQSHNLDTMREDSDNKPPPSNDHEYSLFIENLKTKLIPNDKISSIIDEKNKVIVFIESIKKLEDEIKNFHDDGRSLEKGEELFLYVVSGRVMADFQYILSDMAGLIRNLCSVTDILVMGNSNGHFLIIEFFISIFKASTKNIKENENYLKDKENYLKKIIGYQKVLEETKDSLNRAWSRHLSIIENFDKYKAKDSFGEVSAYIHNKYFGISEKVNELLKVKID